MIAFSADSTTDAPKACRFGPAVLLEGVASGESRSDETSRIMHDRIGECSSDVWSKLLTEGVERTKCNGDTVQGFFTSLFSK